MGAVLKLGVVFAAAAFAVLLSGCTLPAPYAVVSEFDSSGVEATEISTFVDTGAVECTEGGKPIMRVFSTTTCPHCVWVREAVDATLQEYVDAGKIAAYHWELDTKDDALTAESEGVIPESELEIWRTFNSRETVPTFIFGCRYVRVGNGHEKSEDIEAEIGEFKAVIEALIKESSK